MIKKMLIQSCMLLLLIATAHSMNTDSRLRLSSDSKSAASEFLGNDVGPLTCLRVETYSQGAYHVFSSNDYYIKVNALTGEIEYAFFKRNIALISNKTMDPQQATSNAIDFARLHGIDVKQANLTLKNVTLEDFGFTRVYSLYWAREQNDVLLPDMLKITVNPTNGQIISYTRLMRETSINLTPSFAKEDAMALAATSFGVTPVSEESHLLVWYTEQGNEVLAWYILMKGEPENKINTGGIVLINAHTGEIIQISPFR